jgi:AraC-like DNA-binding protein
METTTGKLPMGILHPTTGEKMFTLSRFQPSEDTGFFIQHYWVVKWDLRGQPPYRQTVLSHPNVNLIFEQNNSRIYGISPTTSIRLIQEHGWVVGLKFRPGGFYPFWLSPISSLTSNTISFEEVFKMDSQPLEQEIFAQDSPELAVKWVDSFMSARLPERDKKVELVSDIVRCIQDDRTIIRVDDAVRHTGLHKRTLQRLFDRYVGVSPKWVIQRYRLHEAADRMMQGLTAPNWIELSLELGYYDHSHFIRDFKLIVGSTPEEYVREKMG